MVTVPAAAILSRELAVSSLREWMQAHRPEASKGVGVAWHGKAKATLQMVSLQAMLAGAALGGGLQAADAAPDSEADDAADAWGQPVYSAGLLLLWAAAGVSTEGT